MEVYNVLDKFIFITIQHANRYSVTPRHFVYVGTNKLHYFDF